jgi:hypothetical protein
MPGNAIAAKTKTVDNCDPQVVDWNGQQLLIQVEDQIRNAMYKRPLALIVY